MEIELIPEVEGYSKNFAALVCEVTDEENVMTVWHYNEDDGYYSYKFRVERTEEESKIIKEFCRKITEAR